MSIKTAFNLNIPKRGAYCLHGGEGLVPGMEYYSVLVKDDQQEGQYKRLDYCASCWQSIKKDSFPKETQSFWKSMVSVNAATEMPKQYDLKMLHLLKKMLTDSSNESQAEIFVLSLILMRKRLLYMRQELVLENSQPVILYETADTEEILSIPKLSFSSMQMENIQAALREKFVKLYE